MPTKIEKDAVTGTETTGHEWDGLKELNTPLPKWWLYLLYATIAFSAVWVVLYPAFPFKGWTGLTGWVAREAVVGTL
jgi:cytochrome c oxidase cbb3-type subunit 3